MIHFWLILFTSFNLAWAQDSTFYEKGKISALKHGKSLTDSTINGHSYKVNLVGSNLDYKKKGLLKSTHYYNYFKGEDNQKWATNVNAFQKIEYLNIYDSVDMVVYEKNDYLM